MLHLLLAIVLTQPAPTRRPTPAKPPIACSAGGFVSSGMIASLVDGLVTANDTHGNPSLEGNPLMRPFVRGRLPGLLLGWGSMEIAQHTVAHTFHLCDSRLDAFAMGQHVSGVASWLSPRTYGSMPDQWAAYHHPSPKARGFATMPPRDGLSHRRFQAAGTPNAKKPLTHPFPGRVASFQPRKQDRDHVIETETVAVPVPVKKRAKATPVAKEYPPHEHFGSPLNVCRVCGAKYTYTPKPYDHAGSNTK